VIFIDLLIAFPPSRFFCNVRGDKIRGEPNHLSKSPAGGVNNSHFQRKYVPIVIVRKSHDI